MSRPHFHAGCVEIGKATLLNLYAEQFAYTYFFPVWELYGRGKYVPTSTTYFLECHGFSRKELFFDSLAQNVQVQSTFEGFRRDL